MPKEDTGSKVCRRSELEKNAHVNCASTKLELLATPDVASELSTKRDSRSKIESRGNFGVKKYPRVTVLGTPSRSDVPLTSEIK